MLLREFGKKASMSDILDKLADNVTQDFIKSGETISDVFPIERLIDFFDIEVKYLREMQIFSGSFRLNHNGKYTIDIQKKSSYARTRFALAHEFSHFYLRRFVGPIPLNYFHKMDISNSEEERLCDYLASAILAPRLKMLKISDKPDNLTEKTISSICKKFHVSKGVAVRRISEVTNSTAIFWDLLAKPSDLSEKPIARVINIHKPIDSSSKLYIPRFLSSTKDRFFPDIISESYQSRKSINSLVRIQNFGNIAPKFYNLTNVFVNEWSERLISLGLVESKRDFFSMVSFISEKEIEIKKTNPRKTILI
jgi:Zn-dependent peptidase ImmA (M78 family)